MRMKDREAKEQEREDRRARQEQQREAEKTMSRAEKLEKIGESAIRAGGPAFRLHGARAQFSQSIQTGALNNDAAFRKAEPRQAGPDPRGHEGIQGRGGEE